MALAGALPWWIALLAVLALAAMIVWANQREEALRASEARAELAETRAATAEAQLTAQAEAQAATATALARVNSPEAAVDRSLSLLLAAEREPSPERLRALSDAFGPDALAVVRPEVEHLLSGGLHLGGSSTYELSVVATATPETDQAEVRTHERWIYDERAADDRRVRCLVETSDQTYALHRAGSAWQVADIHLDSSSRTDC
jgi:Tfp pilus assembly protein PilE